MHALLHWRLQRLGEDTILTVTAAGIDIHQSRPLRGQSHPPPPVAAATAVAVAAAVPPSTR
jgi:hypothetical protein